MNTTAIAAACAAAALLSGGAALAASTDSPLGRLTESGKTECATTARTFLTMADLRDAGADKSVAISRGVEYLDSRGRTGSHLAGKSHRPQVERFASFIYERRDLKRESLYVHGLYSCAISKLAADDPSFEKGISDLDAALLGCQKKYPDKPQVKAMGTCIEGEADRILSAIVAKTPGTASK